MEERAKQIKLGEHDYTVVAQRHAYLQRKLGPMASELADQSAADTAQALSAVTGGLHQVLSVFIPELMPLWEWEGFASETAYRSTVDGNDQYDEAADRSPTTDQMVVAMQAVAEVNRLDLVKHLKDLVGPDFIRALRARAEVEITRWLATTGATDSPSLRQPSGESAQTNGGTSRPTEESSSAGPTPASPTT